MFALPKSRWLHFKNIGKVWWLVVTAVWGAFWAANKVIEKWGSPSSKAIWDKYTLHLPFDWKIGLIGLLATMVVLLVEGSFRYHQETLAKHQTNLNDVADVHGKELLRLQTSHAGELKEIQDAHIGELATLQEELIATQQELAAHQRPDITGEILHARRPMRIAPHRGHEASMVLLKLRVSTRTNIAATTIRRANLIVESNGKKYEGKKQPIEIEPVTFHYQFSQSREERPFDLIDRIAKEPLRYSVGAEGWLQFLVDGLPNAVGVADLYLTITDDLGGEHPISAKSFPID